MCLSGLMGVDIWARVTEKGKECCWCRKGVAASFLVVLLSSVLTSQRTVHQIRFEAEYHTTIILYVYLCYWLDQ